MIKSFIDMVNESARLDLGQNGLVDEMGVKKPERLTGSQMGRIRQSSIDRRTASTANANRSFIEIASDLIAALKRIPRTEISMEKKENERRYYPKFPQPIVDLMLEAKRVDENQFTNQFGRWRDAYPTSSEAIYFKTEGPSDFQRSHFPNGGIPPSLRGIGLGYKLYRTLLKYAGYISSNTSGTTEKDKAWGSLLAQKTNPDGSLSVDDAHAVIGPSNWMALDKETLPDSTKSQVVMDFITRQVGLTRTASIGFDMDDELLAILPDEFLTKLDSTYLESLVADDRISQARYDQIEAARSEVERQEAERLRREAEEARERRAREEQEQIYQLSDRILQYGASPANLYEEWEVGDYVVIKRYLFDTSYGGLPIRKVIFKSGNTYYAAKILDAMKYENGEITLQDIPDIRQTNNKLEWIKVNIDNIIDLDRINLNQAEKAYIESQMDPAARAEAAEIRAENDRRRAEQERTANANRRATIGQNLPTTPVQLSTAMDDRMTGPNSQLLKKIRSDSFYTRCDNLILDLSQRGKLESGDRAALGLPVWIAFRGSDRSPVPVSINELVAADRTDTVKIINMVSGEILAGPLRGLGLTAYPLSEVTVDDKRAARAGERYYIAGHRNSFGIIGQSEYGAVNTTNQRFIYIRTMGWGNRSVSVRLDLLRKLGAPQEIA